jgi:toxin ParE1/3/4
VRITYSPRAVSDLIEIGDYLSERNPSGAVRVEQRIRKVVELITDFPASGRSVASRPNVRSIPLGTYPYWVFYTTLDDELIVLHIRHSSREPIDPSEL